MSMGSLRIPSLAAKMTLCETAIDDSHSVSHDHIDHAIRIESFAHGENIK